MRIKIIDEIKSKVIEYLKDISLKIFFYLNVHTEIKKDVTVIKQKKAFNEFEDIVYQEFSELIESYYKWRWDKMRNELEDRTPASDRDLIRSIRTFSKDKQDEFALVEKSKSWEKLTDTAQENVFRELDGLPLLEEPVKEKSSVPAPRKTLVIIA